MARWLAVVGASLLASTCQGFVAPAAPRGRVRDMQMAAGERALIIQNKGGGHGEIGYHLALNLAKEKGLKVTVLNDKYNPEKEPFRSYGDLQAAGVEIISAELLGANVHSLLGDREYEYVIDNFAKGVDTARPVAELAIEKQWPLRNYAFVSSGGMYKPEDEFPLLETDPVSETNEARKIEVFLTSLGLPVTFFRPQYIYGPKTNKRDYLDWFFDRVVRRRPVPLPKHGDQFTTLTNVEDVASMIAGVVDNPRAVRQVFNCASDRYVTFKEVVRLVGEVTGNPDALSLVVTYDPAKHKADLPKGWFPFRNTHFNVSPEKAKRVLNWQRKHDLRADLAEYYTQYRTLGLDRRQLSFDVDDKVAPQKVGA